MKKLLLSLALAATFSQVAIAQNSDGITPASTAGAIGFDYIWNGSSWDRYRSPSAFKNVNAVLVTAESTVWTPAAGKKFRLIGYCLTQGVVTGAVTLKDNTAGTTILIIPQNTIGVSQCGSLGTNGILSAAINNVLTATGAATETITGYFYGTEE